MNRVRLRMNALELSCLTLKKLIMEQKAVQIQIPDGYEIDHAKSTFERIVFKKKVLTYEEVMAALLSYKTGYFIDSQGTVLEGQYCPENTAEPNAATNRKQLEQIIALNKLMNVAQYLNGMESTTSSRSGKSKYLLYYSRVSRKIDMLAQTAFQLAGPTFNSEALARQAIEILGETEVKKAFGIFE